MCRRCDNHGKHIWFFMIASGVITAALTGRIDTITDAIVKGAEQTITIAMASQADRVGLE